MNKCAVIIPIYKLPLTNFEMVNIDTTLENLKGHQVFIIAPDDLDIASLHKHSNFSGVERFNKNFFKSVSDYSRLMLSDELYMRFESTYSHILVCQTDAVILKPELSSWLVKPYDYIGAPWRNGYEIKIKTNTIPIAEGIQCKAYVGNGGLSLRRIDSCLRLFNEFKDIHANWIEHGHAEDLFFGFTGSISKFFQLPNIMTAALFSHETDSDYFFKFIGNQPPFGVHGFDKYSNSYIERYIGSMS